MKKIFFTKCAKKRRTQTGWASRGEQKGKGEGRNVTGVRLGRSSGTAVMACRRCVLRGKGPGVSPGNR